MNSKSQVFPESPVSSVDWRLLVPFTDNCRILVGGNQAAQIAGYLDNLGADAVVWPSGPTVADFAASHLDPFDVVAIPLGFSNASLVEKQHWQANDYSMLYKLLRPGGTLLIGFSNLIGLRRGYFSKNGFSTSPGEMMYLLKRANFVSVRFYGVVSRLAIPRYIFPLEREMLDFVLRRHFRHKVPGILLSLFTKPVMLSLIKNALPSYFVTASTSPA